jgi:hypothetical protein
MYALSVWSGEVSVGYPLLDTPAPVRDWLTVR